MKKVFLSRISFLVLLFWLGTNALSAQLIFKVGDNSTNVNDSAVLELESSTKGFLPPRMTKEKRDQISTPAEGLMVWCTDCSTTGESELVVRIKGAWATIYASQLEEGKILIGNANAIAKPLSINGDLTMDSNGKANIVADAILQDKIADTAVTFRKIQKIAPFTILGRTSADAGTIEEIASTGTEKVVLSKSPIFSGIPSVPKAALETSTDQIASTAFVMEILNRYFTVNANTEISTTATTDQVISGMQITPGAGTYSVLFNSEFSSSSEGTTARGTKDLTTVYNQLNAIETTNFSHASSFGDGEILNAGVYAIGGAGSISGKLTLTGNSSSVFIFKINGALTTAAGTSIVLNGVSASNVFWIATSAGAMSLAANVSMKGSFLAKDAACTIGTDSTLEGRLFSNSGAITTGLCTITVPSGSSSISFGELSTYALFSSAGAISNGGTSTITGNIGSNSGAISGFASPTVVNGSLFSPVADVAGAVAHFSVYENGTLVVNSARKRMVYAGDISLQAIATVADGQSIDIRWNTSLGILKLQNRILTLIKLH